MRYRGPYRALVQEVLDFARGDDILAYPSEEQDRSHLLIIDDVADAIALCEGDELAQELQLGETEVFSNLGRSWVTTCQERIAEIYPTPQPQLAKIIEAVAELQQVCLPRIEAFLLDVLPDPLGPLISTKPPGYYRQYVASKSAIDLIRIAEHRAFHGIKEGFWESLFNVYKLGAWPCQWKGIWPDAGQYLVWLNLDCEEDD